MCSSLLLLLLLPAVLATRISPSTPPLVVAHRGASGEYPELTLKAFEEAFKQGADFVEIDTAITRDKTVIVLHEAQLSVTTNVANFTQFAGRRRNDTIWSGNSSKTSTDWFTWDFDLREIQLLRKFQRMSYRDQAFNFELSVPTLKQTLNLTRSLGVGLLIEVKDCDYFSNRTAADTAQLVADEVKAAGLSDRPDLVSLQAFELSCAAKLKSLLPALHVYKLEKSASISNAQLLSWSQDLKLDGIGVHKAMVADGGGDPASPEFTDKYRVTGVTDLVNRAHSRGLSVMAWTFRNEDRFIPWTFGQDANKEIEFHRAAGIDGLITDFPGTCKAALQCNSAADKAGVTAAYLLAAAAVAATAAANDVHF